MSFQKPPKRNLFQHLAQNITDSNNGLNIVVKESGTVHRIYPLMLLGGLIVGLISGYIVLEWLILVAIFFLDFVVEIINSAIEEACDLLTPNYHPRIKRAKDLSSAAVYICHLAYIFAGIFFAIEHAVDFKWWQHLFPAS